jgi:hypothetical protein
MDHRRVLKGYRDDRPQVPTSAAGAEEHPLCFDRQVLKALAVPLPAPWAWEKHERPIALTSWQRTLVSRNPEGFLRGLIHSDGCRFINPIRHGQKVYRYPRYNFSNASADIRKLFSDACDLLGIEWRVMNARNISVARRASVARLDEFVGPKR